jgi:hypothetical protein
MSDLSSSPPDLSPTVPEDATPEECIRLWMDVMDASEQFLLAGLRREIGPDGDLKEAYRRWYAAEMEQHDRMIRHMMDQLKRRGGNLAR